MRGIGRDGPLRQYQTLTTWTAPGGTPPSNPHNPLDGLDAPCCRMSRLTLLSLMPYRSANSRFESPATKAAMSRSTSASESRSLTPHWPDVAHAQPVSHAVGVRRYLSPPAVQPVTALGGSTRQACHLAQDVAGEFWVDLLAVVGPQLGPAHGDLSQSLIVRSCQGGLQAR